VYKPNGFSAIGLSFLFIYKMYLWHIYVNRRTIRSRTITVVTFSGVFVRLHIISPFDGKIFTEYKIPRGERIYNVSENNISEFIKSHLYNKVVGEVTDLTSEIEHTCDITDIHIFPIWKIQEGNSIICLQKLNDLMFELLV